MPGMTPDTWLSGIFGHPVWRVDASGVPPHGALVTGDERVFAYTKVSIEDVGTVSAFGGAGFQVVDVALNFEGLLPEAGQGAVRAASVADRARIEEIAGSSFRFSRFHADPAVPDGIADSIKANWAGNFFSGHRGDAMLVVERHGRVAGFAQLLHDPTGATIIDLIAVAPEDHRQGVGSELIHGVATHGAARSGSRKVRVGTQAANTPSVRLYESHGLRLASAQYVLHFHWPGHSSQPTN